MQAQQGCVRLTGLDPQLQKWGLVLFCSIFSKAQSDYIRAGNVSGNFSLRNYLSLLNSTQGHRHPSYNRAKLRCSYTAHISALQELSTFTLLPCFDCKAGSQGEEGDKVTNQFMELLPFPPLSLKISNFW